MFVVVVAWVDNVWGQGSYFVLGGEVRRAKASPRPRRPTTGRGFLALPATGPGAL